jgi:hypothetical protein
VLRTHSDEEAVLLQKENLGKVFMGENELARGMTRHVLVRMGIDTRAARKSDCPGHKTAHHPA